MKNRRILDSRDDGGVARQMLEAGKNEVPSDEAMQRTLRAVGVRGRVPNGEGGAGKNTGGSAGVLGLGKWWGAFAVAAFVGGAAWWGTGEDPPSVRASGVVTEPSSLRPSDEAASQTPISFSAPSANPTEVASATPAASTLTIPAASTPPRIQASDADLTAEIAALDRARQALDAANPESALTALEDYRRAFPHGTMSQEATLLRIEALMRKGDAPAARRIADAFLAAHPGSPHAPRIRHVLEVTDAG